MKLSKFFSLVCILTLLVIAKAPTKCLFVGDGCYLYYYTSDGYLPKLTKDGKLIRCKCSK